MRCIVQPAGVVPAACETGSLYEHTVRAINPEVMSRVKNVPPFIVASRSAPATHVAAREREFTIDIPL